MGRKKRHRLSIGRPSLADLLILDYAYRMQLMLSFNDYPRFKELTSRHNGVIPFKIRDAISVTGISRLAAYRAITKLKRIGVVRNGARGSYMVSDWSLKGALGYIEKRIKENSLINNSWFALIKCAPPFVCDSCRLHCIKNEIRKGGRTAPTLWEEVKFKAEMIENTQPEYSPGVVCFRKSPNGKWAPPIHSPRCVNCGNAEQNQFFYDVKEIVCKKCGFIHEREQEPKEE